MTPVIAPLVQRQYLVGCRCVVLCDQVHDNRAINHFVLKIEAG